MSPDNIVNVHDRHARRQLLAFDRLMVNSVIRSSMTASPSLRLKQVIS